MAIISMFINDGCPNYRKMILVIQHYTFFFPLLPTVVLSETPRIKDKKNQLWEK